MVTKSQLELLCDEDVGTGVPNALQAVDYRALSLYSVGWGKQPDIAWLAWAGRRGLLVFSCNKRMLLVDIERETIIREKVGIVFLTNGEEHPARVLMLLLRKWSVLELLHATEPRPFVKFLAPYGKLTDRYRQFSLY